jgi:hypothetical protein
MGLVNLPFAVKSEAIAAVSWYTKAHTEQPLGKRSSLICGEAFVFIFSLRELQRVPASDQ